MIDCVCQEYQNGLSQEEVAKNNKTSSVTVRRFQGKWNSNKKTRRMAKTL